MCEEVTGRNGVIFIVAVTLMTLTLVAPGRVGEGREGAGTHVSFSPWSTHQLSSSSCHLGSELSRIEDCGVDVIAGPDVMWLPGGKICMFFQIMNTDTVPDTFSIELHDLKGWWDWPPHEILLDPFIWECCYLVGNFTEYIPPEAQIGEIDTVWCCATSHTGASVFDCDTLTIEVVPTPPTSSRGNVNCDCTVDWNDENMMMDFVYNSWPIPPYGETLDANDDGEVNILDRADLVNYILGTLPTLAPPSPNRGYDPTPDPEHPGGYPCPAFPPWPEPPRWPHGEAINVLVSMATDDQTEPQIVSDDEGNSIVVWEDYRKGEWLEGDIRHPRAVYAQRIYADGVLDTTEYVDGAWIGRPAYEDSAVNLEVSWAAEGRGHPQIMSAGDGWVIVVWEDHRYGHWDIYAALVSSHGVRQWETQVCGDGCDQRYPQIVPDGSGGAIIAWQDDRHGDLDIYAQHVRSDGAPDPGWPTGGRAICTATGDQWSLAMATDGEGGAIIAWQDDRPGDSDIYVQRVLGNGQVDPRWPADGLGVCTEAYSQRNPTLVSDDDAGAIIAWDDFRGGNDRDIYIQRVNGDGWPQGRPLCTAQNDQWGPVIATDGSRGAFVAWQDSRYGDWDIYLQRVDRDGQIPPCWPTDGMPVCTEEGDQTRPDIVYDHRFGALVTWQDFRNTTHWDIYIQRADGDGRIPTDWPANGRSVSTASGDQQHPALTSFVAPDVGGDWINAVIVWHDNRNGAYTDIYTYRVKTFVFPCEPLGDVTSDGDINVLDAVAAVTEVLTPCTLVSDAKCRADCNQDGGVDVLDVVGIVNVILGIGACPPVPE